MKTRTAGHRLAEAAVGAGIGAVIAGPIGAVAGGLLAAHIESGLAEIAQPKKSAPPRKHSPPDCSRTGKTNTSNS